MNERPDRPDSRSTGAGASATATATAPAPRKARVPAWRSSAALLGLAVVAAARLLTLPRGAWEYDEMLFVLGVERFDPLAYRPHPPGYPLLIGLGKVAAAIAGSPFHGLLALAVAASLAAYLALVDAFASLRPDSANVLSARRAAVTGALFFSLSATMLVYAPMALSEAPAAGFMALALAAAGRLARRPSLLRGALVGAAAAAAVGCRPQWAVAVAPCLATILAVSARPRPAAGGSRSTGPGVLGLAAAIGTGFGAVAAAWLTPLLIATGGFGSLRTWLSRQAGLVAAHDASLLRADVSTLDLLRRFLVDPWGPAVAGGAILCLAGWGLLAGRSGGRLALPLLVFSGTELAFELAAMNPWDAARYALPSTLGVAFLAALGVERIARARFAGPAAWALPLALGVACAVYAAPLLRQRATVDPPAVQAAAWATNHLPPNALVLYDREVEAHALALLPDWKRVPADGRVPCSRRRPVVLLADGASDAPGGETFRWAVDTPAWRTLTRQRLGVVSFTPVDSRMLFETLSGVYPPEPSARALFGAERRQGRPIDSWRWLAEESSVRLCPGEATAWALDLRLPLAAPHPEATVSIEAGGSPALSVRLRRGETAAVRLELPRPRGSQRNLRVTLRTAPSFLPAEAGISTGDRRRLGAQLLRATLVDPPAGPGAV